VPSPQQASQYCSESDCPQEEPTERGNAYKENEAASSRKDETGKPTTDGNTVHTDFWSPALIGHVDGCLALRTSNQRGHRASECNTSEKKSEKKPIAFGNQKNQEYQSGDDCSQQTCAKR
jgi:hypothetical protein